VVWTVSLSPVPNSSWLSLGLSRLFRESSRGRAMKGAVIWFHRLARPKFIGLNPGVCSGEVCRVVKGFTIPLSVSAECQVCGST
jgi:hypothetical protein